MCLTEEQFLYFLSLIDMEYLVPSAKGLMVSVTEWIWVSDISRWCIDGVWKDLPNVR